METSARRSLRAAAAAPAEPSSDDDIVFVSSKQDTSGGSEELRRGASLESYRRRDLRFVEPFPVGSVVEIDMREEEGFEGSLYEAEVAAVVPDAHGTVAATFFEIFADDGVQRESGLYRPLLLRPQQSPSVTMQLLRSMVSPKAGPQDAGSVTATHVASLALAAGFYVAGRPVDVWVRGGWWQASIVREVKAEHAVRVARTSVKASDAALATVAPSGPAWRTSAEGDAADPRAQADMGRIFEVRTRVAERWVVRGEGDTCPVLFCPR